MAPRSANQQREVGRRVLELAAERGLTQRELGQLLEVTLSTLWRWGRGEGGPDGDQIAVFCHVLGVSPHFVIMGIGPKVVSGRDIARLELLDGMEYRVREMEEWLRAQRGILGSPAADTPAGRASRADAAAQAEIASVERDIPFVTGTPTKSVKPAKKAAAKKKGGGRKSA